MMVDARTSAGAVGTLSPVVVVVRDPVRDLTAVLWAARYAAATTHQLHVLHLEPSPEPPPAEVREHRVEMMGLQASVSRAHPSVRLTWDLTWRSPARGEVGMPGSGGLLVVSRWADGQPFSDPAVGCTVVVVPEDLRGGAEGVVAVIDPDRDSEQVLAEAREFSKAAETSLLVVAPTEATRASRHAELLVVEKGQLDFPGVAFSALSWSMRRAVAVVPVREHVAVRPPKHREGETVASPVLVAAPIGP